MEYSKDIKLHFTENNIYHYNEDGIKQYVMEDWEIPIMEKHAEIVSKPGAHILEIGFGMGISATLFQQKNPASHTIVEMHPQILEKGREWAKDKTGVTFIEGKWMDVIDEIISKQYDGIFFDPWMDNDDLKFEELVVRNCIKSGGVFSYFFPSGKDIYNLGWKLKRNYIGKTPKPTRVNELVEAGLMDKETAEKFPKFLDIDYHVPYVVYE